jgi:cytochrome c-type biogenesis protein CcmH/NrfG
MLPMTKPSRRKWAIRVVSLVLIGAGAVFLLRVNSRSQEPAPQNPRAAVQDNPAHELKELEVQLQKKPGHLPVLMRMAQIEHDRGELAEAATHLREALVSEPANADVHLELGRVLYEKGDRNEALKETEQALAINPKHIDAMYNLGAIHANLGETERARSYWEKVIESAPESESGKKARESLARLRGGENRRSP